MSNKSKKNAVIPRLLFPLKLEYIQVKNVTAGKMRENIRGIN